MIVEELQVVMAEDDEGHATLVRRNLRRAGLTRDPVHVHDGLELLDYLMRRGGWQRRPDHEALAIVLDLNMPRLGGFDVLRQIKGRRDSLPFPVFVLTTTDNPDEIERCYTLGASACLVKPVDSNRFGDMIQRLAWFLQTVQLPGDTTAPHGDG